MVCGGNRRSHLKKIYKDIKGLDWDVGAISNVTYSGVLLKDLLVDSGFKSDNFSCQNLYLTATGMDQDF
jgi:hypothetical protein